MLLVDGVLLNSEPGFQLSEHVLQIVQILGLVYFLKHLVLHLPHGVFDLIEKLLHGVLQGVGNSLGRNLIHFGKLSLVSIEFFVEHVFELRSHETEENDIRTSLAVGIHQHL